MEMKRPVDEVEAVTSFFYKTLRSKLSELSNTVVHVHNLGNFYIKEKALDGQIETYTRLLEKLKDTDITEYGVKKHAIRQQEVLANIKQKLQDEKLRRRSIINKRFNNESKEERNSNLES